MDISTKDIPLIIVILMIFFMVFLIGSCAARTIENAPSNSVLNKYRQFNLYTDPGEFAYLYNQFPESLDELCVSIKKQLIHQIDLRNIRPF